MYNSESIYRARNIHYNVKTRFLYTERAWNERLLTRRKGFLMAKTRAVEPASFAEFGEIARSAIAAQGLHTALLAAGFREVKTGWRFRRRYEARLVGFRVYAEFRLLDSWAVSGCRLEAYAKDRPEPVLAVDCDDSSDLRAALATIGGQHDAQN